MRTAIPSPARNILTFSMIDAAMGCSRGLRTFSRGVEIGCDVTGLGFVQPARRHRRQGIDSGWVFDPGQEVVGRVRQNTRNVDALREVVERRADLSPRFLEPVMMWQVGQPF